MIKRFMAKLKDNDHVIVFDQQNNNLQKVERLYQLPQIENEIEFDPDHKLENDEWYFVALSGEQKNTMINPYFEILDNSAEFNQMVQGQYSQIAVFYLCSKTTTTTAEQVIFTKVTSKHQIRSRNWIEWEDGPELKKQTKTVDFTAKVDALWNGTKLYFRSFSTIKSLFPGIEEFYRTATEDEKNTFLQKEFFECTQDISKIKVGERNLRRIAAIIDDENIDLSNHETRSKYVDYANQFQEYDFKINDTGQFQLANNKDISDVLKVLEQNLYIAPVTGEKREAGYSKKISQLVTA